MTLSIWRYSHLVLAISSALFLIVASVTGIILAFEPIVDSLETYAIDDINDVSVAQTITALQREYDEVLELEVTASNFVIASVITKEGNSEHIYIEPTTANRLGNVQEKASIFSFTTNLHRSLFLKSVGRFFVGFISLLLCFITVTGILLLAKRQGGFFKLYTKIKEQNFEQRYHIIFGRWFLVPILIIASTGVYLSAEKFSLVPNDSPDHNWNAIIPKTTIEMPVAAFPIFQNLTLKDVRTIAFPFSEDAEDYYQLSLQNKEILVHQYSGEVVSEIAYPFVQLASRLSMQLHTGQGSILWSLVLLVTSGSILFFIYSGFLMTLKRRKQTKGIPSKINKDTCEYILLVGSETGNTYVFAKAFYKALQQAGRKVFLSSLNEYTIYQKATHLIIFTATYGEGEAPGNARNFETRFSTISPIQKMQFAVVGFGSLLYPHYCRYAITVDALLHSHSSFTPIMPLTKINDQSQGVFKNWSNQWNQQTSIPIQLENIQEKKRNEVSFEVIEKTIPNIDDTFTLTLKPKKRKKFQSGDLIAIKPEGEERERQYSIAQINKNILLSVKKHKQGICSSYLNDLTPGAIIPGMIDQNASFHFPKQAPSVILIANGTGLAPFLGMIEENTTEVPVQLFWGGRTELSFKIYEGMILSALSRKRIQKYYNAYSQEGSKQYVQHLLIEQGPKIAQVLDEGGTIMICGSLAMQHSVLDTLEIITQEELQQPLTDFENNQQLLMDCY